jgi:hypothetical protein
MDYMRRAGDFAIRELLPVPWQPVICTAVQAKERVLVHAPPISSASPGRFVKARKTAASPSITS